MALQDMPTIAPLLRALRRLLRPTGRFVFAVPHPTFNIPGGSTLGHKEERSGSGSEVYFIELSRYMRVPPTKAVGSWGEPTPHYFFHRPLSTLLGAGFAAGFVLDALEEPTFGPKDRAPRPLGWAHFKDIPPVLLARLRPGGHASTG